MIKGKFKEYPEFPGLFIIFCMGQSERQLMKNLTVPDRKRFYTATWYHFLPSPLFQPNALNPVYIQIHVKICLFSQLSNADLFFNLIVDDPSFNFL